MRDWIKRSIAHDTFSNRNDKELIQLFCRSLKAGDIMLKVINPSKFFNRGVRLVQKLTGHLNYDIVHAGIMRDSVVIIEAQSKGLEERSLLQKNVDVGYIVYRATNPNLAEGAAIAAKLLYEIHMQHKSISYNNRGLFPSVFFRPKKPKTADEMEKIYQKIIHAHNSPMFCSQFVVYSYQWAATQMGIPSQQIFNIDDKRANPARLAEILQGNPQFLEIGYMIANER